jgi:hypothetical protein
MHNKHSNWTFVSASTSELTGNPNEKTPDWRWVNIDIEPKHNSHSGKKREPSRTPPKLIQIQNLVAIQPVLRTDDEPSRRSSYPTTRVTRKYSLTKNITIDPPSWQTLATQKKQMLVTSKPVEPMAGLKYSSVASQSCGVTFSTEMAAMNQVNEDEIWRVNSLHLNQRH